MKTSNGRESWHGGKPYSNTRLYFRFKSAKERCRNKNSAKYQSYGGRGIEFKFDSYKEFYLHLSAKYVDHCRRHGEKNTSLNRIDNNGHYEAGNLEFCTYKKQANNTRRNSMVSLHGERKNITEWAKITGLNYSTIRSRLVYGATPEEALHGGRFHHGKFK